MPAAQEQNRNTATNFAASHDVLGDVQCNCRRHILATPGLPEAWSQRLETGFEAGPLDGEQLLLTYERAFFAHKYERL